MSNLDPHAKHVRRLCESFSTVEERYCIRQHADAFRDWISKFVIPIESVPARPEQAASGGYCAEGVDIFFTFWVDGDFLIGAPCLPNASDSGLPRDRESGYRIPLDSLREAPAVKRKIGYRDGDGYVV